MKIEDKQARRGEPVIVKCMDGIERPGTIEFGDGESMSIYLESGGRVVLYGRATETVYRDPDGDRPAWRKAIG